MFKWTWFKEDKRIEDWECGIRAAFLFEDDNIEWVVNNSDSEVPYF